LNKEALIGLFLILLIIGVNQSVTLVGSPSSSVIRVSEDYPTIQEAINAASPGDTILVSSGIFRESIVINKSISLIGDSKEKTIIIGFNIGNVIYISSNSVIVSSFTIKGSGANYISPFDGGDAGIILDKCANCTLSNLIVTENCLGIFLNLSDDNVIENNVCYLNSKDGIYLRLSNNNILRACFKTPFSSHSFSCSRSARMPSSGKPGKCTAIFRT